VSLHRQAQILLQFRSVYLYDGNGHWHTLLKARAIETDAIYWLRRNVEPIRQTAAPMTFAVVSPWGEIIAEADESKTESLSWLWI